MHHEQVKAAFLRAEKDLKECISRQEADFHDGSVLYSLEMSAHLKLAQLSWRYISALNHVDAAEKARARPETS